MRIIVCDDHPVVREGLTRILTTSSELRGSVSVREAGSGQALLEALREQPCDVVLLDVTLPGLGGLDVLRQLKQEHPQIPVLMLSVHSAEQYAIRALKAGASGYLTKNLASGELLTAVRTVIGGKRYLTPDVMERLADGLAKPDDRLAHETLSDREFQVLVLLAAGQTVADIARTLCLSYNTISTYRSRIVAKLGVSSQADLIKYGIQHDLVELN